MSDYEYRLEILESVEQVKRFADEAVPAIHFSEVLPRLLEEFEKHGRIVAYAGRLAPRSYGHYIPSSGGGHGGYGGGH